MIEFNQVSKRYTNGHEALTQLNFSFEKGEMAFITGPSGAGKSTLLKLIALMEQPTVGEIKVNGVVLNRLKKRQIPAYRLRLGIAFQTPYLLQDKTVFENVALPLYIQGLAKTTIQKRVQTVLEWVGLLHREKSMPSFLSTGEAQRVGLARAVVHKPDWLLADEPTGHLDPALSLEMMKIFSQLNQVGVGILIATHDLPLIASMRHRIVMLKGGKIC